MAATNRIKIFLTGIILLTWAVILPPSLCSAGMQELSDPEMAAVYAYGFSTFSLTTDTNGYSFARIDFNNVTLSTWTTIDSMKMGYYLKGGTTAWDNDWTTVSLGSSGSDLVAKGLYIEAKFSDITNSTGRQLEYIHIGTTNLTGTVSAIFNSFSGTIYGTSYSRTNLTTIPLSSISADGDGFYLALERTGDKMGYTFNWVKKTTTTP